MENIIRETAQQTLKIEIETLNNLYSVFDESFISIVELFYKTSGRIVVTGVGKSGIVAQKIVATFNSTGTASIFMHASDALHGDLGMIQSNDIVLCLSKSGESSELKLLVPFLKNLRNTLVAVVSNKQSYLAKHADYILHTPIGKEADPNNLAPTASTTAQMVMGDILAMALLRLRGFTAQHFAQLHPAGALGKQLSVRCEHLCKQHGAPAVRIDTPLSKIIIEISKSRLGATAVLDTENKVVGIITDGDLRRLLESRAVIDSGTTIFDSSTCAVDFMSKNPKTIAPETLAVDALRFMEIARISQIIVLDKNKYIGMVHLHDIIREGII